MSARSVIDRFAAAAAKKDMSTIADLLAPDVELHGSLRHRPYKGPKEVIAAFQIMIAIFDSAEYLAEYRAESGVSLLLRLSVRGKDAEGAQFITFNPAGLISEFHDLIRPLSALEIVRDAASDYVQAAQPQ